MTKIKRYMSDIDEVLRDLLFGIGLYFIVESLVGLLVVEDRLSFFLGTIIGCAAAAAFAVHMYVSLDKGLDMEPDSAGKYIFSRSVIRLFMMLVVAGFGLAMPGVSFLGVVLGMLGLKVSALMQPLVSAYITTKIFREGE